MLQHGMRVSALRRYHQLQVSLLAIFLPHTMTFFNHASDIGAKDSSFNEVGRDQTNNTYNIVYNLVSAPERGLVFHRPGPISPLQVPHSETSSRTIVLRPTFRSAPSSARHIAARLIVEIVQSLMDSGTSDQFCDLKENLNTLQQTLDLTGLAIDAFQCIPLGRILASTIGNETEQCIGVLRELLSAIRAYQRGLRSTRINLSWNRVGSGCKSGEIRIWREKLSACQKSLGECLRMLDWHVWLCFHTFTLLKWHVHSALHRMSLGAACAGGGISLQDINRLLRQGPPSLRHIQVNKIIVVDHLGRNIPVPAIVCSAWRVRCD